MSNSIMGMLAKQWSDRGLSLVRNKELRGVNNYFIHYLKLDYNINKGKEIWRAYS